MKGILGNLYGLKFVATSFIPDGRYVIGPTEGYPVLVSENTYKRIAGARNSEELKKIIGELLLKDKLQTISEGK